MDCWQIKTLRQGHEKNVDISNVNQKGQLRRHTQEDKILARLMPL